MLRNRYTCLSRSSVVSRPSVEAVARSGRSGGECEIGSVICVGLRTDFTSSGCVECDCIGDCFIDSRESESLVDRFGCHLIARKILDGSGNAVYRKLCSRVCSDGSAEGQHIRVAAIAVVERTPCGA